ASCFICVVEPRAPECAIIHTEFTGCPGRKVEMPFIIASATLSEHFDQASTTLLYFSPEVIRPSWYCCSYSLTSFWVWLTSFSLEDGITRSSLPKEMPARQA